VTALEGLERILDLHDTDRTIGRREPRKKIQRATRSYDGRAASRGFHKPSLHGRQGEGNLPQAYQPSAPSRVAYRQLTAVPPFMVSQGSNQFCG
jgi:hypothetical protein